ncbi:Pycsar system effector family protein [Paracoccus niistensis]|uniref:Pycsar system effector family protein n=1 Tax=Paracoccus niistensis TaxID=632935 RepID=A0ABV6I2V7_9RHOB
MAKDDQQEAYERLLTLCLARAIDFTKFAEAKNAALLTFASAWVIASVTLLNGSNPLAREWRVAFMAALPFFASAALCSFLPKTNILGFHKNPDRERVMLFFGDAAAFSLESFRDRIRDRYYPPEGETTTRNYLDDLSTQTNINSQIALRKFKLFNAGARLIFVAFAILSAPAVYLISTSVGLPVLAYLSNLSSGPTGSGGV